ncbi:MAG: peroxide stress protein YaaA, partial [Candidatus Phytoplasma australasiaticum]|nr:peroxide stress protein YaaA [Candidatus Phytoplasma australasiaticum]
PFKSSPKRPMSAALQRSRQLLIVLSPAKRLDFTEADPVIPATERRFVEDTASLATTARRQTKADLRRLMGISDDLATLNVARFKAFDPESTDGVQAAFAFAGDVYEGLKARELDAKSLAYAQDHPLIVNYAVMLVW